MSKNRFELCFVCMTGQKHCGRPRQNFFSVPNSELLENSKAQCLCSLIEQDNAIHCKSKA